MWAIFLAIAILFIWGFIRSLKNPEAFKNPKTGKAYSRLRVRAVTITFALLSLLFALIAAVPSSNTSSKPASSPSPSPVVVTQQMKTDYIAFYKQYMSIADKSDATNNKVLTDLNAMSNGTNNLSTAQLYLEASDAQSTQDDLKNEAVSLKVPDSLSGYSDDLNNADSSLFSLISSRGDTMKNMADFLNSNDLSKLKDIRNSTQDQQTAMEQAVVSLLTVGQKLGVDTTKVK